MVPQVDRPVRVEGIHAFVSEPPPFAAQAVDMRPDAHRVCVSADHLEPLEVRAHLAQARLIEATLETFALMLAVVVVGERAKQVQRGTVEYLAPVRDHHLLAVSDRADASVRLAEPGGERLAGNHNARTVFFDLQLQVFAEDDSAFLARIEGQSHLFPSRFVALLGPKRILGKVKADAQPVLCAGSQRRTGIRNRELGFLARGKVQRRQNAFFEDSAVLADAPTDTVTVQVSEEMLVANAHLARGEVRWGDRHVLVDLLYFPHFGRDGAVGEHQAVHTEVLVVGLVVEVSSIGPEPCPRPVFGGFFIGVFENAVIGPFPDASANQPLMTLYGVPVFLEIADGVPHRMGVFAHDERLGRVLLALRDELVHMGVHHAVDVRHVIHAFVMNGAGGVEGAYLARARFEIAAAAGFVTH